MINLTDPKTIKSLLAKYHARPDKSLGQHFLISRSIINKIIDASDLSGGDTALEIGPGLGVLTLELAKHVEKVIAIDTDPAMIKILKKNISNENIDNVKLINSDILKLTLHDLQLTAYSLIANLPYQITSPVLWKFLHEEENKPKQMVIMIQREVADRIIAKPGDMSLLSVLAQYHSIPKIICNVKPGQFFPSPKVSSTVIRLEIKDSKFKINDTRFFDLVKAGFCNKRKMLKNNLKNKLSLREKEIITALQHARLLKKSRAQELSVKDWIKLYKVLYNEDVQ